MERVRLDQHTLEIQLVKELPQHRPLVVLTGGLEGLADRHAQGSRVKRHLGNECQTASGGGLDRSPQGLSIADQLVEIHCPTWDLGDRPGTDYSSQCCHISLVEEVVERGIRWRAAQLQAQRFCKHGGVADGKELQIPQALASNQDREHHHQQQVPSMKTQVAPHARVRDRLEEANQVKIGCRRDALEHREEVIPPTSPIPTAQTRNPGTDFKSALESEA